MARKTKGSWVVAVRKSETLQVLYEGPDRARARSVVEKVLRSGTGEVEVWRVTRSAKLTVADLVSTLPRSSF